ncbi:MAG: hypothetical protein RLZZ436_1042, partial [Planctomycetota bacterium]
IVTQQLQLDPLSGHLFLFVNKRRDSMKAIFWDGDGFVIWYCFADFRLTSWKVC